MTGITGSALTNTIEVGGAVQRIKGHTDLPICVEFGVKTAEQAKAIGQDSDGVVVGSAIVNAVAGTLDDNNQPISSPKDAVVSLVKQLAEGVHSQEANQSP